MQAATLALLFSVLIPGKMWYAPEQKIEVEIKGAGGEVSLILTDFTGKPVDGTSDINASDNSKVELKGNWPQLRSPGTFILYAVPKGKSLNEFVGTPLVVGVRGDNRRDAPPGPMVIRVEPLRYAVMTTDFGAMTIAFFYDGAPDTVDSFQSLADQGFYDGLTFHEIIPDFKIQGGDPRGDGTGGPGFHVEAEFNARKHEEGVLSMARQVDPIETKGGTPRPDFANSAGSQFFICLNYDRTMQLDSRFTAFGKVVDGIEAVRQLGKAPVESQSGRPLTPQVIKSIRVMSVTAQKNPYPQIFQLSGSSATTQP